MYRAALVIVLGLPRLLGAQYIGLSLGRVSATVDWQYPAPPKNCDFCVVDVSPHASRESLAPAFLVQLRPTSVLGFSSEIRYTEKGYATTEPTLNVDYLEVPGLVRLGRAVWPGSPVAPFLEGGPALALRTHCEVDHSGSGDPCRNGVTFGQDWRIRAFDVSGILGFGLAISIDQKLLVAGARYDWGLVNIGGGQGLPTKNRSSLVYLAWLWRIGRRAH